MNGWGKIALGVRAGDRVDPCFLQCWTRLLIKGMRRGDQVLLPVIELPHHYAAEALVHSFLRTECDSILFIDDDMTFDPGDLDKLRDDEEAFEYDMVQGLCLSRNPPHRPIVMEPWENGQFKIQAVAKKDAIVEVGMAGLAFTLCRRSLFDKVAIEKATDEMFFRWSARGDSEDASFSSMVKQVGCRIAVNTRVCIGHRIPVVVKWDHEAGGVAYQEAERRYCMQAYGTHKPVLEAILKHTKIEKVLEFGMGRFSTDFFLGKVKKLVSIEQQNQHYYDMYSKKYTDRNDVDFMFLPGPAYGPEWLRKSKSEFDLIFVDGDAEGRPLAINEAFKKTKIIVSHDTESKMYQWDNIKVPSGWKVVEFKKTIPWTTVWTKDKKLATSLEKLNKK